MPHRYLQALSNPSVLAARERYGSRTSTARSIDGRDTDHRLGPVLDRLRAENADLRRRAGDAAAVDGGRSTRRGDRARRSPSSPARRTSPTSGG